MLLSPDKRGEIQSVCVSLFILQQSFWILNLLNCTNRSLLCLFIPWETSGHSTLCLLWDVPLGHHLSFGWFRDVVICHQGHSVQQTPGLCLQLGAALSGTRDPGRDSQGNVHRRRSSIWHRSLRRGWLINVALERLVTVMLVGLFIFHFCQNFLV